MLPIHRHRSVRRAVLGIAMLALPNTHATSTFAADAIGTPAWMARVAQSSGADAEDDTRWLQLLDADARRVLARVRRCSPFLRQQLVRIARTPRLTVSVRVAHRSLLPGANAYTRFTTTPDGLHAAMEVTASVSLNERLGHELEHIIEVLDGVRLRDRLGAGDRTVRWSSTSHAYETDRAIHAGRIVESECWTNRTRGTT
ncbi:MAG: hypothetical protein IT182_11995 [Acidobacteria bacterium]|nr:hypothetical protein [Acidobacteriota bacterium]